MVRALTLLLLCQLIGTVVQEGTGLPIPGPVFGLILLLAWLVWRGGPAAELRGASEGLLRYLGLLFVPAGVGVVTEFQILRDNALALLIAIPVSTVLGLVVTGVLMNYFLTRRADA
jgi:holin-like protein